MIMQPFIVNSTTPRLIIRGFLFSLALCVWGMATQKAFAASNSPPVVMSQTFPGFPNTDLTIMLSGTDVDGNVLSFRITSVSTIGVLRQYGGYLISTNDSWVTDTLNRVVFHPATNTYGVPYPTFQFVANDGLTDSAPATITAKIDGIVPDVTNQPVVLITGASALLMGTVNPHGLPTKTWFECGTNTFYEATTALFDAGSGVSAVAITNQLSGFLPNQTYHYRAVASNAVGLTYGVDQPFVFQTPFVTTSGYTLTNGTNAVLIGSTTPNGLPTQAWFEWGSDTNYKSTTSFDAGTNEVIVTNQVTVTPGQTYHFRLVATNDVGTNYGDYMSFVIVSPCAATLPATSITGSNAALSGMVVANTFPVKAWFEWGTNSAYGTNTAETDIDSGSLVVWVTNPITNLVKYQSYHYRLAVSNSVAGVVHGADQVFAVAKKVLAWGDNSSGQTNVPALTNVVSVAAGGDHSLALKIDGTVVAWGENGNGQTNVPTDLSNVVAVAGGGFHSLALKSDGTVAAWGYNGYHQTNVPSDLSNVVAVAGGDFHSLALRSNGTVVAWGGNSSGQIHVPDGLSNVVAVAGGGFHSLALKSDGTVVAWGENGNDQTNVPTGLSNVVAVAGGGFHSLALTSNRTVVAWGYGQTHVPDGLSNVVAVAGGEDYSLALKSDGTVVAWGQDNNGSMNVPYGLSNVVLVAAGGLHSLTLVANSAPVANSQTNSQRHDRNATITLLASDADGDPLSLRISKLPETGTLYQYTTNGTLVAIGGANTVVTNKDRVIFVPRANSVGTPYATFDFTANDGLVESAFATVTVMVTNSQPVANSLTNSQRHDTNATITLSASDADGDPLSLRISKLPETGTLYQYITNGTFVAIGGANTVVTNKDRVIFVPTTNSVKTAIFEFMANDGLTNSASATVILNVTNSAPVATFQTVFVVPNKELAITLSGTDPDYDILSYRITEVPTNGVLRQYKVGGLGDPISTNDTVVTDSGGRVVFQPTIIGTEVSNATFKFAANDGVTNSDWAIITVNIVGIRPDVTNSPAKLVTKSSALLMGMVNPNGLPTSAWIELGTDTNHYKATNWVTLGQGTTPQTVSKLLSGFAKNQTYYYRVAASNAVGLTYGVDQPFVFQTPFVTTSGYTLTNGTNAVLIGSTTPNGLPTQAWFEWGLDTNYNDTTITMSAVSITNDVIVTNQLTGLTQGLTNHFRLAATNDVGTNYGEDMSFVILAPSAATLPATSITGSNAVLIGMVVANTFPVKAWFEWGTNSAYGTNTAETDIDCGSTVFWVTNSITNLVKYQSYHYRLAVSNSVVGVVHGADHVFAVGMKVSAWGDNSFGQTNVPSLSNVVAVAAGGDHSLALMIDGTVVAWGENGNGQTNVPTGLSNVVAVAGGGFHSLALKSDGTVAAWGYNGYHQTNVPSDLSNVVAVAGGDFHSLALRINGTVVAWGGSSSGQTNVPDGLTNVVAVAGGWYHSLALKSDGTVVAWGDNSYGQRDVPVGLSNVVAVAAGGYHSVALTSNGTVVAWGDYSAGQTNLPSNLSNVVAIAAGGFHSVALTSNGTVVAWGYNFSGQTNMPMGLSNVVAVAAGALHSMALIANSAPVANSQTNSDRVDTNLSIMLSASDADGDTLQLRISQWPLSGSIHQYTTNGPGVKIVDTNPIVLDEGRRVFFVLDPKLLGTPYATFAFTANDGFTESAPATVTIDVSNTAPVATSNTVPGLPNADSIITLSGTDAEYDALTYRISRLPSYGYLFQYTNIAGNHGDPISTNNTRVADPSGRVVFTATNTYGFPNPTFQFIANDGLTDSAPATITINITNTKPTVMNSSAKLLTKASALLMGMVNPNGLPTSAWIEWGAAPNHYNPTNWVTLGQGTTPQPISITITNTFEANKAYYYRVAASNTVGPAYGLYQTFVFLKPSVTTSAATLTNGPNAVLKGITSSNGLPTQAWFEWGSDTHYGSTNIALVDAGGASEATVPVKSGQTYHFRLAATNDVGTNYGDDMSFVILPPSAATLPATSITGNSAVLGGMLVPNTLSVNAWFEWGTNFAYGHTNAVITNGIGATAILVTNSIQGLTHYQTYHFRLVASNSVGVAPGADQVFAVGKKVLAWGNNTSGQANVLDDLTTVVAVAGGQFHSLALKSDGTVAAWGYNGSGQLNVPYGLNNVVSVAGGYNHSLALKSDGTVAAWGNNTYGQTNVPDGLNNVVTLAAGYYHNLALKSDGTVVAWGYNNYGQTSVPDGLSNVVAVAGGEVCSLALKSDGTVVAWGQYNNGFGYVPMYVPAGLSNVVAVAAGGSHSLALKTDKTVVAWGHNGYGQTSVPVGLSNVVALVGGQYHSLALRSDSTVVPWGQYYNGSVYLPMYVPVGLSNVVAVAGGYSHSLALAANRAPVATSKTAPGVPNPYLTISLSGTDADGDPLSFRITEAPPPTNGSLHQYNADKPDGVGDSISANNTPVTDSDGRVVFESAISVTNDVPNPTFQFVANDGMIDSAPATIGVSLVLTRPDVATQPATQVTGASAMLAGMVNPNYLPATAWFEWGTNSPYEHTNTASISGSGATVVRFTNRITGLIQYQSYHFRLVATNSVGVAQGADQVFAVGKKVLAWGDNSFGQTNVLGDLTSVVAVAGGQYHSLALMSDGTVAAWGYNSSGQLNIPDGLGNVVAVAAGYNHSLALKSDETVAAWGNNNYGQTSVPTGLTNVVAVAGGLYHSLALKSDGTVVAWGYNYYGQTSVPDGLSNVVAVAGGEVCSLALKSDGTVIAWGQYNNGFSYVPMYVPDGLSNVVAVAAGGNHSLALQSNKTVVAWGYNGYGQTSVPAAAMSNVVSVVGGSVCSLALKKDGTVVAWGQYNNGTGYVPMYVPAGLSNVVAVAGGGYHSLALAGNHAPVATPKTVSGITNPDVPISLSGTDADGDSLSYRITEVPSPTNGYLYQNSAGSRGSNISANTWVTSLDGAGGHVIFSPAINSDSNLSFQFIANDGVIDSAPAIIRVSLNGTVLAVTTLPAKLVTGSSALLIGTVSGFPTNAWIEWGPTASYGNVSNWGDVGAGTNSLTVSKLVAGFSPNQTNHYRVAASNSGGVAYGEDQTLVFLKPSVTTSSAFLTNGTVAVLNGSATPNGLPTQAWFEWGSNTNYAVRTALFDAGSGTNGVAVTNQLTGLTPGMTYHFRLAAINDVGTNYGADASFVIILPDAASTLPATSITGSSAALRGMLVPGAMAATAWFEWGTSLAYGNRTDATNVAGGTAVVGVTYSITGLTNYQVYHFRLAVRNSAGGIAYGGDQVFAVARKVLGWGYNYYGQTNAPDGLSNVVAVAGGGEHSLALKSDGTVVAWGYNGLGQTNVPDGLTNVVAVAGGGYHSLALKSDGTLAAWGYNGKGQTHVPVGSNNVMVVAGDFHSLSLQSDGTVVAWGDNGYGQTNVPAGLSNVVAVAAGGNHSLALQSDGTVVAWGDSGYGQTHVPVGLIDVVAVAAGGNHSLALRSDGTVVAWGQYYNGSNYSTMHVPDGLSGVVAVAAGGNHSLALKSDGKVVAWGQYYDGLVYASMNAPDGLSNVVAVAAGGYHSLALVGNRTPVAMPQTTNGFPGTVLTIQLSGTDADSDSLRFKISVLPSTGRLFQYSDTKTKVDNLGDEIITNNAWVAWVSNSLAKVVFSNTIISSFSIPGATFQFVANDRVIDSAPAAITVIITNTIPTVINLPAKLVNKKSATLMGMVNPNGLPTSAWIEWGTNTSYGHLTNLDSVIGSTWQTVSNQVVFGFVANQIYHYQVCASNIAGAACGGDQTFVLQKPIVTNSAATLTNGTTAVLNGSANPNGLPTQAWFEWGIDNNYINSTNALPDPGSGTNEVNVTSRLTVTPGQVYHYRLAASNDVGTNYSTNTLVILPPSVATLPATLITGSNALLSGMIVANTFPVTNAWFEWGTNSTYGNKAAVSGLFSGSNMISVTSLITSLTPYQSYHFRLVASNSVPGLVYGGDQVFAVARKVVAWGYNGNAQTNVPNGLSNVVAVAACDFQSLAIKSDGTVVAWGYNGYSQTNVPEFVSNVVAVAGGVSNSLALKSDGTVIAWGDNGYGQTNVPNDLNNNVVAVAGGWYHSLALKSDGTVFAWGATNNGQTNVPAGLTNVVAVAAGGGHSLALKSDGTVAAWGYNGNGQTNVPKDLNNVVAVAAGYSHSLALMSNGMVVGWGANGNGQTNVPKDLNNVVAVAAGVSNSLALKSDGTVVAWGDNGYGQTNVPTGLSNVVAVAGGRFHSLALVANNNAPVANSQTNSQRHDTNAIIQLSASDADGDPLTLRITRFPETNAGTLYQYPGELNLTTNTIVTNGIVMFLPATNSLETATFEFTANDGSSESSEATVTVNVTNSRPFANPQTTNGFPGTNMIIQLGGTDLDGDSLAFKISTIPEPSSGKLFQYSANRADGVGAPIITNNTWVTWVTNSLAWVVFSNTIVSRSSIPSPAFQFVAYDGLTDSAPATITVNIANTNPTVTTLQAELVTKGSVWLNGTVIPNGLLTGGWIEWGTDTNHYNATNWFVLDQGTKAQQVRYLFTNGFDAGKPYYYRVAATNAAGTNYGQDQSFVFRKPSVINSAATPIDGTTEVLNGRTIANGLPTKAWFEWGTDTNYTDTNITRVDVFSGSNDVTVAKQLTNLTPGQTYHFRLAATNDVGTNYSADMSFVIVPPWAATLSASSITGSNAVLNGMLVTNTFAVTNAWFEWGTNSAYGHTNEVFLNSGGATIIWVTNSLTNLVQYQSYHFRLAVRSSGGELAHGGDQVFAVGKRVVAWGAFNNGQTNVPVGLSNVVAVAAGVSNSLALKSDGTVVAWGDNSYGLNVTGGLSNVVAVAAGVSNSLALKNDGTVVVWGNTNGLANVSGDLTNVVAVAAGGGHTLALRSDGTVVAWGYNSNGQANVSGLSKMVAVAAGGAHSLALKSDGTVFAWGDNSSGQTNVPTGLSNVVAVAAGGYHSLALKSDGTVFAWGDNSSGQTNVPTGLSNVVAVAAGVSNSLALKSDGTVFAWGATNNGQTDVPVGLSNVVAVAACGYHTLALVGNSTPVATSQTNFGLPNNDLIIQLSGTDADADVLSHKIWDIPIPSVGTLYQYSANGRGVGIITNYTQVTDPAGRVIFVPAPNGTNYATFHFVANDGLIDSASAAITVKIVGTRPAVMSLPATLVTGASAVLTGMVCPTNDLPTTAWFEWWTNSANHMTNYVLTNASGATVVWVTNQITGLSNYQVYHFRLAASNIVGVTYGADLVFAVGKRVMAWGSTNYSQTNVPGGLSNVVAVAGGGNHSLALKSGGTVVAWGDNSYGQTNVPVGLRNVMAVAGGGNHSIALKSDGRVVAWGSTNYGQTNVPDGLRNVVAVAGGKNHSIALRSDGTVVAWGDNTFGQTDVPVGLNNVVAVAGGWYHSLALKSDGTVAAWGDSSSFQTSVPVDLSNNVVAVAGGGYQSLALKRDGTVVHWGGGSTIVGLSNVVMVAAGGGQCLALNSNGTVVAWGDNSFGQTNVPVGLSNVVAVAGGEAHNLALVGNNTPVATSITVTGDPIDLHIQLSATDADGDHLSFKITAVPTNGSLLYQYDEHDTNGRGVQITNDSLVTNSLNFVVFYAGPNKAGTYSFQFVANDGVIDSDPATNTIDVITTIPNVTTLPATLDTRARGVLNGMVNPNSLSTTVWFEWGTNLGYGNTNVVLTNKAATVIWVTNSIPVTNYQAYHFRLVASNIFEKVAYGADQIFAVGKKVVAWGDNGHGQTTLPVGLSNVVAVAGGYYHSLALKSDGTVAAWGDNNYHQTSVPATLSNNVVAVAGGDLHSLALTRDGKVVAWGANGYGQTNVPASALSNVVAVAGGYYHSLALKCDGTVVAWGDNSSGQTNVPIYLNNNVVVAVAAGAFHSLVLRSNGTVFAWGGDKYSGQTNVPVGLSNVVAVAAGGLHSLAVLANITNWPVATSKAAEGITATTAVLKGVINPYGLLTSAWFEWGTNINYRATNIVQIITGSGTNEVTVTNQLTGLTSAKTYHFRLAANTIVGIVYGDDVAFTTIVPTISIVNYSMTSNGTFHVEFMGFSNTTYSILSSTNLTNWSLISTQSQVSPGYFKFDDRSATNDPKRFYQLRWP